MAKKKYEEANIEAIADTIREKTGTENTYKVSEMAEGVGEVFEVGKQAEYDAFWDALTANKIKTTFTRAFQETDFGGKRFPDGVTIENCNLMFYNYKGIELPSNIDLSTVTQYYLDYQGGESLATTRIFAWATKLKKIYDLKLGAPIEYWGTFEYCRQLETIEMSIKTREETKFSSVFTECHKLVDITFEGVIGKSLDIHWSPLSPASLKSIIKHLKHCYGTADEFKYTLTVKASAWNALEAEGLTDDDYRWIRDTFGGNPTLVDSWSTLMGGWLGWNLVLA